MLAEGAQRCKDLVWPCLQGWVARPLHDAALHSTGASVSAAVELHRPKGYVAVQLQQAKERAASADMALYARGLRRLRPEQRARGSAC